MNLRMYLLATGDKLVILTATDDAAAFARVGDGARILHRTAAATDLSPTLEGWSGARGIG